MLQEHDRIVRREDLPTDRAALVARIMATDSSNIYELALLEALPAWTLERIAYPERVPLPPSIDGYAAELIRLGSIDLLPGEQPGGWSVYRINFADGSAYVGITCRLIAERLAEHLGCRYLGKPPPFRGNESVRRLAGEGVKYCAECLASGLEKAAADVIESREIGKLAKALNHNGVDRR